MSHSIHKLLVHAVWSTKDWAQLINPPVEKEIYDFLKNQLEKLDCSVRIINGMPDHIHCLFYLDSRRSISEVMKQIKGSSTHFVNKNKLTDRKFAWQTGYGVFAVSHSFSDRVYYYIKNQKKHHQKKSFKQEYDDFKKAHESPQTD